MNIKKKSINKSNRFLWAMPTFFFYIIHEYCMTIGGNVLLNGT